MDARRLMNCNTAPIIPLGLGGKEIDQEISIPLVPNLTELSRVGLGTKLFCAASSGPHLQLLFTGPIHHKLRVDLASSNLYSVDEMVTPTAARMMQATRARMFRPTATQQWGFVFRENRVPYYQRLFQNGDGKRQWWKTSRSGYFLYPYYVMLYGSVSLSFYGMLRMLFGHKTMW
ncbi:uncharacterized protein A1O9_04302 [Exophiala aquamarina CBS 119918]|uniref:Uncharacterized protein n=1 Tax=Exophiala aquamarina CBS 119918 TaxID=1182545 RepID=A0A072PJH1_9EURO|nr:uncharacterized protein A1O9_04302 [Exophiala aquamarina CBS 119918]KEF59458.1 hypothetical protein A1O9_04302 [Exophiala aquamarina CBS 119918]